MRVQTYYKEPLSHEMLTYPRNSLQNHLLPDERIMASLKGFRSLHIQGRRVVKEKHPLFPF